MMSNNDHVVDDDVDDGQKEEWIEDWREKKKKRIRWKRKAKIRRSKN